MARKNVPKKQAVPGADPLGAPQGGWERSAYNGSQYEVQRRSMHP